MLPAASTRKENGKNGVVSMLCVVLCYLRSFFPSRNLGCGP